ncbi:MAG: hypothetical protein B7Z69_00980, partial [Actinobacteria bacterium 21-73-9]
MSVRAGTLNELRRRSSQWLRTSITRWLAGATYTKKWLVLGTLIGVISGLGAVVFYECLKLATHYLIVDLGGYQPGSPRGEGNVLPWSHFTRPWALPLVAAGGALVGSVLVFSIAPDAEGHGTDAAIAAVHHNPRGIRVRTVVVKIVASAFTIGSGGSGGREGPTGQISAGFGSLLARVFDLSPTDARLSVASGIGSGIGAIFGAPLAGAVLATEILYRDDFEVEALLPSFIASIVGYALWGSVEGFGPLFGYQNHYHLHDALQLFWFAVLGVIAGVVGLAYAKGFYGIAGAFARTRLPRWVRPVIGGALVGLMGLVMPEVLGTGYGFIQQIFGRGLLAIPLWIVVLTPLARIAATGFSIGSGGSGGIFGPGMVIGGFLGAALWRLFEPLAHGLGPSATPFIIVGMMSCFGSISRAPLAVMLMVAEMTGSLSLVVPAMLAVGLATLVVRRSDDTIYRSQLRTRADAPAHRLVSGMPLLESLDLTRAARPPRCVVGDRLEVTVARRLLEERGVREAPVVDDDGRYVGRTDLTALDAADEGAPVATSGAIDTAHPPVLRNRHLGVVLESLTAWDISWLAVVDDDRKVVGTVSVSDLVSAYRFALRDVLNRASRVGPDAGTADIVVEAASSLCGQSLREAGLPHGTLVTAIERARQVLIPTGDTTIEAGDRLSALGA